MYTIWISFHICFTTFLFYSFFVFLSIILFLYSHLFCLYSFVFPLTFLFLGGLRAQGSFLTGRGRGAP